MPGPRKDFGRPVRTLNQHSHIPSRVGITNAETGTLLLSQLLFYLTLHSHQTKLICTATLFLSRHPFCRGCTPGIYSILTLVVAILIALLSGIISSGSFPFLFLALRVKVKMFSPYQQSSQRAQQGLYTLAELHLIDVLQANGYTCDRALTVLEHIQQKEIAAERFGSQSTMAGSSGGVATAAPAHLPRPPQSQPGVVPNPGYVKINYPSYPPFGPQASTTTTTSLPGRGGRSRTRIWKRSRSHSANVSSPSKPQPPSSSFNPSSPSMEPNRQGIELVNKRMENITFSGAAASPTIPADPSSSSPSGPSPPKERDDDGFMMTAERFEQKITTLFGVLITEVKQTIQTGLDDYAARGMLLMNKQEVEKLRQDQSAKKDQAGPDQGRKSDDGRKRDTVSNIDSEPIDEKMAMGTLLEPPRRETEEAVRSGRPKFPFHTRSRRPMVSGEDDDEVHLLP